MKFITEDMLRMEYRNMPFVSYQIDKETRLTPGGRQFLLDRQIEILDERVPKVLRGNGAAGIKQETPVLQGMRPVRAMFLKTGMELLDTDVLIAQEIFQLEQHLANLKEPGNALICNPCTGIRPENFAEPMEDCFEITGFHAQLNQGKVITALHYLRCLLRESFFQESGDAHGKEEKNRVVNRLSQIICLSCGGKECQKKH